MKEYKISDIENLEEYVLETIKDAIKDVQETYEKMGFALSCQLVPISEENDSLIRFTVRTGNDSFSFSLCFIARGKEGGYYVSPLIKDGNIVNDALLMLEQVKKVLIEKEFSQAKEFFDGIQKNSYKDNIALYKFVKGLKFAGGVLAVLALGAVLAMFIIML